MAKYVQDKKTGKMKGSIGDGKTRIPQASQQLLPLEDDYAPPSDVPTIYDVFKDEVKTPYVYPYTYEEYSTFAVAALEKIGQHVVASKENSFRRSGITTLSGRNQSTVFEEEFAIPYLTNPANQARFKKIIEEAVGDSKFVFLKFREPRENSADPNIAEDILSSDDPAALKLLETDTEENPAGDTTRAWADLFLVATYNDRTVYFPINIKCSSDNSYDNTASWQAASFVVFNNSRRGRSREAFYAALQQGGIEDDAVNDYFFWNFTKGDPEKGDKLCTDSVVCSYLEFPDPADKVFRANTSQSFPLQINTSKVAEARAEQALKPKRALNQAKKESTRKLTLGIIKPERDKAVSSLADTTAAELVVSGARESISEEELKAKKTLIENFARELFSTPDVPSA